MLTPKPTVNRFNLVGNDSQICVTVLVIAHHESVLVHRTLKSVYAAVEDAERNNVSCEIIVVLDRGDEKTRRCVTDFPNRSHQIIEADVGDLALAREAGRAIARGQYISLIDGDDLYGEQWLTRAYQFANAQPSEKIILHAEHQIFFDAESFSVTYFPSSGPGSHDFNSLCLASANHWTSILFFSRDTFANRPFTFISRDPRNSKNFGFGYEDWHWISEQIANGAQVCTVPQTCNFVRRKRSNSMLQAYSKAKALLPPTSLLFPPEVNSRRQKAIQESASSEHPPVVPQPDYGQKNRSLKRTLRKLGQSLKKRFPKTRMAFKSLKSNFKRAYDQSPLASAETQATNELLWDACKKIHFIEPKIFPSNHLFSNKYDVGRNPRFLSFKYEQLCESVQRRPTHVFLVPWLKQGGSDLETLNYIEAVCNASPDNYPVVISTVDTDSPWAKRIPKRATFVNFGRIFYDASHEDQKTMLATFLVQLGAPVIHNVNSHIGYQIFREHSDALKNQSKLYVNVFCEDITSEGRIAGYAFDEMVDCVDSLSGVFTDNARIIDYLVDLFGIPREKFHLHYQPIAKQNLWSKRDSSDFHVVWAGRMDRQKRTDILYRIVEKLENESIRFSIYGASVLGDKSPHLDWTKFSHVRYHGPYDGFDSLPPNEFDVLLHTAQWEGLPNVLLEALSRGLPVVASDVGGVSELTQNQTTGIAISPFDNVDEYCSKLIELRDNRELLNSLADAGLKLVRRRHSWESFRNQLLEIPEYYLPTEQTKQRSVA